MTTDRPRHRYNVPSARELRTHQTPVELLLWEALRSRRLGGLKFRRQHPVGPFIVDFCCPEQRLAIELDGAVHATQREHDAEREELLAAAGYRLLRFPNEAVRDDLPAVLETVRAAAAQEPIPPSQRVSRTTGW
jgi:very-short-patch-repair endonuclease